MAKDDRYQTTQYRRCGKSGLSLPPVSLGLWHNFGEAQSYQTAEEMLTGAFDLGVTHFDLANNYGPPPGSAEFMFGQVFHKALKPYRDEMIISTKSGYYMWPGPYGEWGSRKQMLSSLDQSLSRMKLDYVDIFYHHRPDPSTPLEESMGALASAVQQGKALYVGLSNYSAEDTKKASQILKNMGIHCLIHQPCYNLFNRWVEDGLYDVLADEGIGSIPFSPLAQGLLTNRYLSGIPADSRAAGQSVFLKTESITEDKLLKVAQLNALAEERSQTLAQMALSWVLRSPVTASVIIGASKLSQIVDCVKAQENLSWTNEELSRIETILKG